MTPYEFFSLVADMRRAQIAWFGTHEQRYLRMAKATEAKVDAEIARVQDILRNKAAHENVYTKQDPRD